MDTSSFPRMIAYARIGFAAAALFKPKVATVLIGGKPSQLTPMALAWAGGFASREAALGALTLGSEGLDTATRRKVLLVNAAVDTLDSLSFLVLAKRQRSLLPLLIGAPGSVLAAYSNFQAAQQLAATPDAAPAELAYARA
jgi:hypothetical protein